MDEITEQNEDVAKSAEFAEDNLPEADQDITYQATDEQQSVATTDNDPLPLNDDQLVELSAEDEIDKEVDALDNLSDNEIAEVKEKIGEKIENDESKENAEIPEPTVQIDGIEGAEKPVAEPDELELLSQHETLENNDIEEENEATKYQNEDLHTGEDNEEELVPSSFTPENKVYDRESLLQQYKESLEERGKIQHQNQQLQHKLSEYFKKKKTDDRGQEIEKNVNDQEQRYMKYMSNLEELQKVEDRQSTSIEIQLEEMNRKCTDTEKKVEEASNEFIKFKYEIAANAINSRSGKQIPAKDLEQYRTFEAKKEQEVITVRLENIKLKNRLKKREQQLKAKEELAEGLHLIDFEQLKIENQTYHEKIEERNEELLKLRKKITNTVQVLTHLKEKLQFVQGENGEQRAKLRDIEVTVAQRRDILTRLKQVRDALRIDNNKLKHKAGLLGNKPLLHDYEIRKDEGDELRDQLEALKKQHVDLNLSLQGVKKKIEKSKHIQSI